MCVHVFVGGSLERLLHDFGAFHPLVITNYTRQVVFGLAFLHNHGIIHRDLKGKLYLCLFVGFGYLCVCACVCVCVTKFVKTFCFPWFNILML